VTSRGEVRDPVNPAMATETVPGRSAPPPRRRTGGPARFTARGVALLRSLRRYLPDESQHLFALTLLVGALCGLVAVAFHLAIRGAEGMMIERALHAGGSSWMVWTIVTPTAGGLLAGAALTWLVPGARGSGIPQVKQAFAREGGRIRFRDALGKFFIGAFQIGSGASLGREGPTVQICAGAASALARVTALPPRNMRRLLPVGVAAGIAAAFNAPIAAVTYGLAHVSSLAFYALLGLAAALVSIGFTDGLLWMRARFRRTTRLLEHDGTPIGVVTKTALATTVLELHASLGRIAPSVPTESTHGSR
jgi:chloride channel protein, CIC family